jgi:hypothetical protein
MSLRRSTGRRPWRSCRASREEKAISRMKQYDSPGKIYPAALIVRRSVSGNIACAANAFALMSNAPGQENEANGCCLSWLRAKSSALNSCRLSKTTIERRAIGVAVRENTDMTHVSEVATLLRKIADYSRLPLAVAKKRATDDRLQQPFHPVMRSSSAHGKRQNSEK